MHKELPKVLAKLKERGFSVKLDTNGFFPDVFEECLGYVDFVAMDVKTCREKYKLLGAEDTTALMKTMEIIKTGKVPYEFRTTVVPQLVTAQDANCIGEMVKGSKIHALQQFIPDDTLDKKYQALKPYAPETIDEFAKIIRQYTENVTLRI
jgi:pyruvate formate lyase activating enzyme